MASASVDVMLVGPLPPPVDGRAQATEWLLAAVRRHGHRVAVVNTHAGPAAKIRCCVVAAVQLLRTRRPGRLIVVASGGVGLLAEAFPLLAARIRRVPTTLSHHSARYVRDPSRLFRIALLAAGPRLRHAVLDEAMGAELAARYGVDRARMVVVDNVGLMPLPAAPRSEQPRSGVVHLSNLTAEKGLAAVLEVARRTGVAVRLIGAPSAEAAALLDSARRDGIPFRLLGPRHGDDKLGELCAARCFLLLSSYRHEAQPLVLYEAVAAGCIPIAWDTGWITGQLARLGFADYVYPVGDVDSVTQAVTEILALGEEEFAARSARARDAFEAQHRLMADQFRSAIA